MDRESAGAAGTAGGSPRQLIDVLGVPVDAIDLPGAVARIARWIDDGRDREFVCVRDVHGIVRAQDDPELLRIHRRAGMVTPDGMPVVWCGRWAGASAIDRVYGPELVLALAELGAASGWRVFYFGGAEGVAESFASTLSGRFPGLRTAGCHTPPFRELSSEERAAVIEQINAARPDLVLVGLSTPKQERWMDDVRGELDAPVLVGVGAAFDLLTGRVRQAPRWIQRSGFEWLFRLAMEPRRLARRYAVNNPRFLMGVAASRPRRITDPDSMR